MSGWVHPIERHCILCLSFLPFKFGHRVLICTNQVSSFFQPCTHVPTLPPRGGGWPLGRGGDIYPKSDKAKKRSEPANSFVAHKNLWRHSMLPLEPVKLFQPVLSVAGKSMIQFKLGEFQGGPDSNEIYHCCKFLCYPGMIMTRGRRPAEQHESH